MKEGLKPYGLWGVLAFLVVILPWLVNPYFRSVAIFIGIYTMVVLGLCFVIGYCAMFNLSAPAFVGIGAYTSGILTKTYSMSPVIALILGAILSVVVAYTIGRPVMDLARYYFSTVTFSVFVILQIMLKEMGDLTGGAVGLFDIPYFSVGGLVIRPDDIGYLYLVWVITITALILSSNLINSRVGRAIRSIASSEAAAETSGVNVPRYKLQVFMISSVLASTAGSLRPLHPFPVA